MTAGRKRDSSVARILSASDRETPMGGALADRVGGVRALTVLYAVAACAFATISTGISSIYVVMPVFLVGMLALGGFLRSNHLTAVSSLAFADIPDTQVSQASSFTAVVQQMSQALGITVAGLMLHVSQLATGPHGLQPLAPENFILPFAMIGLGGMAASLFYLSLPANAGAHMHGREGVKGRR